MAIYNRTIRDYARERMADAERNQALSNPGAPPLRRRLGVADPDTFLSGPGRSLYDPSRLYDFARNPGARGGGATSDREKIAGLDVARDVRQFADSYDSREFMAQRQRQSDAIMRGRERAVQEAGGGPPAPASAPAGMTMGDDGVLSGSGGPVSRRPTGAASVAGAAPSGGIADATGVAGGSPMQTAAYREGLAQGPENEKSYEARAAKIPALRRASTGAAAGMPPPKRLTSAGPDGRGWASDMQSDPGAGTLDRAIEDAALAAAPSGITLNDVDLQEMLARERGVTPSSAPGMYEMGTGQWSERRPDPRAEGEAMARVFGGSDPFDATGLLARERASDPEAGRRQLEILEAARQSSDPFVQEAGAANIERVRQDVKAAEEVAAAVRRERLGEPSPWEREQFEAKMAAEAAGQTGLNRRQAMETLSSAIRAATDMTESYDPDIRQEGLDRLKALEIERAALLAADWSPGGGAPPSAPPAAGVALTTPSPQPGAAASKETLTAEEYAAAVAALGGDQAAVATVEAKYGPAPGGTPVTPERAAATATPNAPAPVEMGMEPSDGPVFSGGNPYQMVTPSIRTPPPGTPEPPMNRYQRGAARLQRESDEREEARRVKERAEQVRRIREQRAANIPYDPTGNVPWYERLDEARWRESR